MGEIINFSMPQSGNSYIKVIGVGGGGSNAVNYMHQQGIMGVDFVVCNTDNQALVKSSVLNRIQLGATLTEGMGAGSKPEVGKDSAVESIAEIEKMFVGNSKMVFITAGMGGGTGTGAAPVIAKTAKNLGLLTVGIVTIPFKFEGKDRINKALDGVEEMQKNVDALLVINNDRLIDMYEDFTLSEAFKQADNVLTIAAKGIAELITMEGYINVDFADVRTVMKDSGVAIMGSGSAEGENRALNAIKGALNSPLLNDNDIKGAKKILLNITSGDIELTMKEVKIITDYLQKQIGDDASIIFGTGRDEHLGASVGVTLIATGFPISVVHDDFSGRKGKKIVAVKLDGEESGDDGLFTNDYEENERGRTFDFKDLENREHARIQKFYNQLDEKGYSTQLLAKSGKPINAGMAVSLTDEQIEDEKFMDYIESVPAYERKDFTAAMPKKNDVSGFSISNEDGEIKLRDNNRFLHDNVD